MSDARSDDPHPTSGSDAVPAWEPVGTAGPTGRDRGQTSPPGAARKVRLFATGVAILLIVLLAVLVVFVFQAAGSAAAVEFLFGFLSSGLVVGLVMIVPIVIVWLVRQGLRARGSGPGDDRGGLEEWAPVSGPTATEGRVREPGAAPATGQAPISRGLRVGWTLLAVLGVVLLLAVVMLAVSFVVIDMEARQEQAAPPPEEDGAVYDDFNIGLGGMLLFLSLRSVRLLGPGYLAAYLVLSMMTVFQGWTFRRIGRPEDRGAA